MTKFLLASLDGGGKDYPSLGFSAGNGSILDGSLFTPPLTVPPTAEWSVYGGGSPETPPSGTAGVKRYAAPAITPTYTEPNDGYLLTYSDANNAGTWQTPAAALTPIITPVVAASIGRETSNGVAGLDGSGKLYSARIPTELTREASNGVAGLDATGKLIASRIPTTVQLVADVDSKVGTLTGTEGSATRTAVTNLVKGRETYVFNALDYGTLDPSGVVDSTAAIQAAAAATTAAGVGTTVVPPGVYKVSSEIWFASPVDARGAIFITTATIAVRVGKKSGGVSLGETYHLPYVTRAAQDNGAFNVVLQNLNTCKVYIPGTQASGMGVYVFPESQGFVYNEVYLGVFWQNRTQMEFNPGAAGWVNQNNFYGGRFQSTTRDGSNPMDTGATDLRMQQGGISHPNGNTFYGTSFEGNITAQYRMMIEGSYNRWINCRWENYGGDSIIRFGATASKNVIDGGYDVAGLTRNDVSGQTLNKIVQPWV